MKHKPDQVEEKAQMQEKEMEAVEAKAPNPPDSKRKLFLGLAGFVCLLLIFGVLRLGRIGGKASGQSQSFGCGGSTSKGKLATSGKAFRNGSSITITNGANISSTCTFTAITDGYNMECNDNGVIIPMKGTITSGSSYSLESEQSYTHSYLLNTLKLKTLVGTLIGNTSTTATDALSLFSNVYSNWKTHLAVDSSNGFHLTSSVDFGAAISGTNPQGVIGQALKLLSGLLKKLIPGYNPVTTYKLLFGFEGNKAGVTLTFTPVTACIESTLSETSGTKMRFNSVTISLGIAYDGSSVSFSGGTGLTMYIKPTKLDPWLKFTPSLSFPIGGSPPEVKLNLTGSITGKCNSSCANSCSCSIGQCNDPWNPLGQNLFSVNGVTFSLGVKPNNPYIDSVAFSANEVKFGTNGQDLSGSVGGMISLDPEDGNFGYHIQMGNTSVNFKNALNMLGNIGNSLTNLSAFNNLAVRNFQMSFATTSMTVGVPDTSSAQALSPGYSMQGDVTLGNLNGSLSANLNNPMPPKTLADLTSSGTLFAMFGVPEGNIKLTANLSSLTNQVLNFLSSSTRKYVRKLFSLQSVGISLSSNNGDFSAAGSVGFKLLKKSYNESFSVSLCLQPQLLPEEIAKKISNLVNIAGFAKDAFNAVKNAAQDIYDDFFKGCSVSEICIQPRSDADFGCFKKKTKKCTFENYHCYPKAKCGGCWAIKRNTEKEIKCESGKYIRFVYARCANSADSSGESNKCNDNDNDSSRLAQLKGRCDGKRYCIIGPDKSSDSVSDCPGSDGLVFDYFCSNFCPLGMYRSSTSGTMCYQCAAGTYRNVNSQNWNAYLPTPSDIGSSSCTSCPAGTYSNDERTECTPCPAGKYSSSRASSCTSCSAGRYSAQEGQSSCTVCPVGTYQNDTGKTSCKSCPYGQNQDQTGQSSCKACPIAGQTGCGGQCVNLQSNAAHCGGCGKVCSTNQFCSMGTCTTKISQFSRQAYTKNESHTNDVLAIAISPSGHLLASGSKDNSIKIWDISNPTTLTLLATLTSTNNGHSNYVHALAFSPDGTKLASGGWDNKAKLWNISNPSHPVLLQTLGGHTNYVLSVTFTPDGQHLITGSSDNTIKLWNVANGNVIKTLSYHTHNVYSVAASRDGKTLYSGSCDYEIGIWDITTPATAARVARLTTANQCHTNYIYFLAVSPDGKLLASSSRDKTIKLWNLSNPQLPTLYKTLNNHTSWVFGLSFSPDSKTLVSGSFDKTVRFWNVSNPAQTSLMQTLTGHTSYIWGVAYHPSGKYVYYGSYDNNIYVAGHCADSLCNGICADLQTSTSHCGTCGTECTNGKTCQQGSCACPPGHTYTTGGCKDLQADSQNCGTYGTVCGAGERCCSGTCVNTRSNHSHCGSCGNACQTRCTWESAGCYKQICSNSQCTTQSCNRCNNPRR